MTNVHKRKTIGTGDFFQIITKINGKFSAITGIIKDKAGKELTDEQGIKRRCKEYTKDLYRNQGTHTTFSLTEYDDEPPILLEEVTAALKKIAVGKAPGDDGLPIELVKEAG